MGHSNIYIRKENEAVWDGLGDKKSDWVNVRLQDYASRHQTSESAVVAGPQPTLPSGADRYAGIEDLTDLMEPFSTDMVEAVERDYLEYLIWDEVTQTVWDTGTGEPEEADAAMIKELKKRGQVR